MMWSLPLTVEIHGKQHKIRNKCDYRVVLDVIEVFKDEELGDNEKVMCALTIFYEDITKITDYEKAAKQMLKVINLGEEETEQDNKPKIMDWEHDFQLIAPPVSRVLGYSVRDVNQYTHWYDFIGAYMEIGECQFSSVISIRTKRMKGQKLDKSEEEFYRENKKMIDLPQKLTKEEQEWLDSDW